VNEARIHPVAAKRDEEVSPELVVREERRGCYASSEAGGATEVRHHPMRYLVIARVRVHVEQRDGGDDHAGRAKPALHRIDVNEGMLRRMQLAVASEALDRRDRPTDHIPSRDHTRAGECPVDHHAARAARGLAAAVLCAGQPEVLSQPVKEATIPRDADLVLNAVDDDPTDLRHQFHTMPGG